jgi:hypothetical protein
MRYKGDLSENVYVMQPSEIPNQMLLALSMLRQFESIAVPYTLELKWTRRF